MIHKSTFKTSWFLLPLILILGAPLLADRTLGINLVKNSGFENGLEFWTIQQAKVVSAQAHDGEKSLQYENANPASYRIQSQVIPAAPGQKIHFNAWIKGTEIVQNDPRYGASVFMQSYDEQGKYLGGSFPAGKVGTFDWTQINGLYIVPEKATKVMIGVYLRKGATGTAWFDDVSAQVEEQPPFVANLVYPNYRGLTTPDQKNTWKVLLSPNLFQDSKPVQIISRLQSPSGEVLSTETRKITSGEASQEFMWQPHPNLVLGQYQWHFAMSSLDGKKLEQQTLNVNVRANMPRVYIDSKGFTVVEGHRFFSLGIFTGASRDGKESYSTNSDLSLIANAGFNTILSYSFGDDEHAVSFLDDAESEGLHVIYSLKDMYSDLTDSKMDDYLNKVKKHPSLLAWYINDESGPDRIPELNNRYQRILQTDETNHPSFQVLYQVNQLNGYLDSLDVIGSDPYPITDKPIKEVSEWTRKTVSAATSKTMKSVWQVLQLHDKTLHNPKKPMRPPSLNEMRNMSYQALIGGTKGLIYYSYTWLWANDSYRHRNQIAFDKRWPDVQKLIHEIKPLTDVILKDNKVDLKVLSSSSAQYQAWQYEDKLYLMVANAAENKTESLQLQIPDGWHLGEYDAPGIQAELANHVLKCDLSPIASGTIIINHR